MPRDGALTLSDLCRPSLTIVCEPRGRFGYSQVAWLMKQYGDAKLTELLQVLADCPKTRVAGVRDGCKAVYAGLDFGKS
jgi:hypothetical protein